jgi:diguanylate cyclase (GGDEF)-like protein/PAS domain S-box-containing protein
MDTSYKNILEQLNDGIYYVDMQKKITFWNKAAKRITGFEAAEVMGRCCADNILRHVSETGAELCIKGCPLGETLSDGKDREANVYLHHKDGHRVPVTVRVTPVRDEDGQVIGAVEIFTDIDNKLSLIKELETLKKEVLTDDLTQIGNRKYADHTLSQKLSDWHEHKVPFSVFFIDIDHFKKFNDTYGHNIGDKVLKIVAKSISAALRPFDIACRWGGEEFVAIVPNITDDILAIIGERIRMLIERSWLDHDGEKLVVTASVGCATILEGESLESLIERADDAMYQSKNNGRNTVTIV